MFVPALCFLLYLPVTASSSGRVVRSSCFCPDVPKKNYTDAEFHYCLGEIDSEYELKIIFGLMQSAPLVNKMVSIGAFQEAVLIVAENLVQIAALVPEVSLVSDLMPIEQFKNLTSPKSFRASLIQMVESMRDSFLQADTSMNRVKLNLIAIPSFLESTIKLLSSDERQARASKLNISLERLDNASKVCENEAETVVTKFGRTIEMLRELHRGCLTCESNSKTEKVKKEQMKIAYEAEAAAEMEYADQIEKYEQEMRERKQVKKMGNFTELSEMIEYLEKGMVLLTEAKKEIKNSSFFHSFSYMARKIREIAEIIKRMTEIAGKQTATGRKLLADQVIASVAHVTAIATVMHVCAETYTETSSRWIMPTITAVGKNLHLSKEEARAKLSQTKSKAPGQLGNVTKFLTARMEQAMDQSKKRTLDFIKELD